MNGLCSPAAWMKYLKMHPAVLTKNSGFAVACASNHVSRRENSAQAQSKGVALVPVSEKRGAFSILSKTAFRPISRVSYSISF